MHAPPVPRRPPARCRNGNLTDCFGTTWRRPRLLSDPLSASALSLSEPRLPLPPDPHGAGERGGRERREREGKMRGAHGIMHHARAVNKPPETSHPSLGLALPLPPPFPSPPVIPSSPGKRIGRRRSWIPRERGRLDGGRSRGVLLVAAACGLLLQALWARSRWMARTRMMRRSNPAGYRWRVLVAGRRPSGGLPLPCRAGASVALCSRRGRTDWLGWPAISSARPGFWAMALALGSLVSSSVFSPLRPFSLPTPPPPLLIPPLPPPVICSQCEQGTQGPGSWLRS